MRKFKEENFKNPVALEVNTKHESVNQENNIKLGSGYLKNANADFDGNVINPLIIVPMLNKKNLLTESDEPYCKIVDSTFKDYINNIDKNYSYNRLYSIIENIKIRYAHQLSSIIITNMNIIFDFGILRFLCNYVNNIDYMRKLYLQKISDEAFNELIQNIRFIFGRLVCSDEQNTTIVDYTQKTAEQLDIIIFTEKEITAYVMKFISGHMYEFINDMVFGDIIDCNMMNLDIISNFAPETRVSITKNKENVQILNSSSKSMCIQYLLETLNMDMHVIRDMVKINYYNAINMMIPDIINLNQIYINNGN